MGNFYSSSKPSPDAPTLSSDLPDLTLDQRQEIATKRMQRLTKKTPPIRPAPVTQELPTRDDYIIRDWIS